MTRSRIRLAIFLLVLLAAPGIAQDLPTTDDSTPAFEKALALWKKGRWVSAQRAFRKLMKDYPETIHWEQAEVRSDDNCYLGTVRLHEGGPSDRRIDVAVMGDGFTIDGRDQQLEWKWAKLCVDVLFNERSFAEYRDYFNIYFVRLASLEEGVDPQLSEEQRRKIEERNRRRTRKRKTQYDTALDCKAAGPQGQVMADRGLVFEWLGVANEDLPGCGDDGLVIAFARFGRLGMGGAGVANVGRPDKSITVHEFGHAFTGLLDEYANNPNAPRFPVRGANAASTDDPKEVPWAHFLERRVKGVGIYEGGATYKKGVWRPARTCAMNAAGATQFCPVCREANVLAIYAHVNPVDETSPDPAKPVRTKAGDDTLLRLLPMKPRSHGLEVTWLVKMLAEGEPFPKPHERREAPMGWGQLPGGIAGYAPGSRGREDRSRYDDPPPGEPSRLGKTERGKRAAHVFSAGELAPGRHVVTAVVRDTTPWVLLDRSHLLEERVTWSVEVE